MAFFGEEGGDGKAAMRVGDDASRDIDLFFHNGNCSRHNIQACKPAVNVSS